MRPIIVEFFGMPGSGKSFLAKHLVESLRQEGFQVSDRAVLLSQERSLKRILGKVSLVVRGLLLDRRLFRLVLSFVSSYKATAGTKIKLIFNWLYLHALIRTDSKNFDFIVLDQGVGQALWSTLFYGEERPGDMASSRLFKHFLNILPIELLHVVHVHAHDECIERRLEGRKDGKSPLDRDRDGAWQRATLVTGEARLMLDQFSGHMSNIRIMDVSNQNNGVCITELDRIRETL